MSTVRDVDVAVVGGGPAGIAAAARAAEHGRSVLVIDRSPELGGNIWRQGPGAHLPADARSWLVRLDASGAAIATGASVIDAQASDGAIALTVEHGEESARVRAASLVIATGARERWIPFPGWTLPGVLGVGGAQALLKSGMPVRGRRVVIAGTGPLLFPVAASMCAAGAHLELVAEQASVASVTRFAAGLITSPGTIAQAARYRAGFAGVRYSLGAWIARAEGDAELRAVIVTDGRTERRIECDLLCVGHGLVPNVELARHLGCEVRGGSVNVSARQETSVPRVYAAGETTGVGGADLAIVEGQIAGLAIAGRDREAARLSGERARWRRHERRIARAFAPRAELRALASGDTILCRCEDVRCGAVDRAWSARQAKLYTRAGMGPCQGRVCGPALEFLTESSSSFAADSVRAPIEPARIASLIASSNGAPQ